MVLSACCSLLPPHKVFLGGGKWGFLLVLSPKIKVEAALCLGRNGPFKVPCSEQSGAAVVVAPATKPGLFLKNTQQKKLLFVPLPPSSQRRSSTAHVPPTPSSPSKACLVWDVLSHQRSGRQARLLQLQEHIYTLSLGMEGSGWQEEQPWCRNSCNNTVGASFKGWRDAGCKITQAEQGIHIPGYPQHSQLLLFPTFRPSEDCKEEFNFPCPWERWQELPKANLWAVAPLHPVIINSGETRGLHLPAGLGTTWDRGMFPAHGMGWIEMGFKIPPNPNHL